MATVLDSSALLAYLWAEPGATTVSEALRAGAFVSVVNLAEVLTRLADKGHDVHAAYRELEDTVIRDGNMQLFLFDDAQALHAAHLRASTRSKGLSLGDRACLALAAIAQVPVYTADRGWEGIEAGVEIRFIR